CQLHHCYSHSDHHRPLHSSPTRRSSDLTRLEDRLQAADPAVAVGGGRIKLAQVGAGPEPVLEVVGLAVGLAVDARLAEDDHPARSEEHTSELQSRENLVCRLLLEKKNMR